LLTAAASSLTSEGVTTSRGEATAAAVHHVEQDVGVDVDVGAVHASHAAHTTHSSHSTHATHAAETTATTEHVSGVHEIISIIVSGLLPVGKLLENHVSKVFCSDAKKKTY
jgi:hypothetical protein